MAVRLVSVVEVGREVQNNKAKEGVPEARGERGAWGAALAISIHTVTCPASAQESISFS